MKTMGLIAIALFLVGCSAEQADVKGVELQEAGVTLSCSQLESQIDMRDRIETLRSIAHAFAAECYETVVTYGTRAQEEYKYKTYSVHKELSTIFVPEGTWIDYVLESYERGFLNALLAASYYHLSEPEASKVELRRLDHELFTPLYNYGEDPVNLLFSAVMWEVLGEHEEAWVDWNRLQGAEHLDEQIRTFASQRLQRVDAGEADTGEWKVHAFGRFPSINWSVKFVGADSGYFSVKPQQPFLLACTSDRGILISTASWFQKIAVRHSYGYHPLLHAQSWIRLPIGVVYSVTTFTAGASIMIGGCAADALAEGKGGLCQLSIIGGVALMSQSPRVLRNMLEPDLRHWDNVPSSLLFTTAHDLSDEPCVTNVSAQDRAKMTKLLG